MIGHRWLLLLVLCLSPVGGEAATEEALLSRTEERTERIREVFEDLTSRDPKLSSCRLALVAIGSFGSATVLPTSDLEFVCLYDKGGTCSSAEISRLLGQLKPRLAAEGIHFDFHGWVPRFSDRGQWHGLTQLLGTPQQVAKVALQPKNNTLKYALQTTRFLCGNPELYREFKYAQEKCHLPFRVMGRELNITSDRVKEQGAYFPLVRKLQADPNYSPWLSKIDYKKSLTKLFVELTTYLTWHKKQPFCSPFEELRQLAELRPEAADLYDRVAEGLAWSYDQRLRVEDKEHALRAMSMEELVLLEKHLQTLQEYKDHVQDQIYRRTKVSA